MNALGRLTDMQNRQLELEVTNQLYNKEMQSSQMNRLSSSYDDHSLFFKEKSLSAFFIGIMQIGLSGACSKHSEKTQLFGKIAGEVANRSITTYHENRSPQFTSVQTTAQKKLDMLVQSANTETNKSNQLQQTLQNAKETYSQLLKK